MPNGGATGQQQASLSPDKKTGRNNPVHTIRENTLRQSDSARPLARVTQAPAGRRGLLLDLWAARRLRACHRSADASSHGADWEVRFPTVVARSQTLGFVE